MSYAIHPPVPAAETYTVRQAAELTGLSEHNLRYYEQAGVIVPIRRDKSSGHRRYTADDLVRLETLACLRSAGMSLQQMKRYFECNADSSQRPFPQRALLESHRSVLAERLRETQTHLAYLEEKIAYWRAREAGDDATANAIAQRLSLQYKSRRNADVPGQNPFHNI